MANRSVNGGASTANINLHVRQLELPALSDVARILQDEMNHQFREVNVDIAACPCLTRAPFNLAGIGLCGNTTLIVGGAWSAFRPNPLHHYANWNVSTVLKNFGYDSFVIGAGFAARPYMPYNGHLIMNATYRAPNITNASRIVFAEASNGQRRIETLTEPNQMVCSYMGNFFLSEGKQGNVIRVCAKGRESNTDIISVMQNILYRHFQVEKNCTVALGGILKMKNGQAAYNVMPEEYPEEVSSFRDLARWYQCHDINLEPDLVAVGTLINDNPEFLDEEQRYGFSLPIRHHQFHSFSNYGAGGQFISDITGDVTEYEGYFNLASKIYTLPYLPQMPSNDE